MEPHLDERNVSADIDFVVGALVADSLGRLFFQRRAIGRKLFPGCWDIVGGHVEGTETLIEALEREIYEETGWRLNKVVKLIQVVDWKDPSSGKSKKEFDYIVEVDGDLESPRIENDKHDLFCWIFESQIGDLLQNRRVDDSFIVDLAEKAFSVVGRRLG